MPSSANDQPLEHLNRASDLIDVSSLRLSELMALPETTITTSLKRILREIESKSEAVAGFQSGMP
jgi:FXSXX-COOH protein